MAGTRERTLIKEQKKIQPFHILLTVPRGTLHMSFRQEEK
jgi:hypothetical protein